MSIRTTLLLLFAAALMVTAGSDYWLTRQLMNSGMTDISRHELTLMAESLKSNIVNMMVSGADMQAIDQSLLTLQKEQPEILSLRVMHGPAIDHQFGKDPEEEPRNGLEIRGIQRDRPLILTQEENGLEVMRFIYPLRADKRCLQCHDAKLGEKLGAISLALNVDRTYEKMHTNNRYMLIYHLVAGLILFLVLIAIIHQLVFRRLEHLREAAERVEAGDFGTSVPDGAKNEIGRVTRAFNHMMARLQSLIAEKDGVIYEQINQLRFLEQTSRFLSTSQSVPELLDEFARNFTESAHVTATDIALLDDDHQTLAVSSSFPIRPLPDSPSTGTKYTRESCPLVWQVMESRTYRFVAEDDDLSECERDLLLHRQAKSAVCFPLIGHKAVLGVAILSEFRAISREPIDAAKIRYCITLAQHTAAAIENGQLRQQLILQTKEAALAMADAVDKKSAWTAGHSKRVAGFAVMIAKAMGWSDGQLEQLHLTALLHDIGKIGTSGAILNKLGKLTEEEYAAIKRHPADGAHILSNMQQLHPMVPGVRHHHEWFNGNGYPDGLQGEEIPLAARILAVADAFDSMTESRPYRPALTTETAIQRLLEGAGTQFDPEIVDIFVRCLQQSNDKVETS